MTVDELKRHINIALEKTQEDGADPEELFVAVADYLVEQSVDLSKKQIIVSKLNELLGAEHGCDEIVWRLMAYHSAMGIIDIAIRKFKANEIDGHVLFMLTISTEINRCARDYGGKISRASTEELLAIVKSILLKSYSDDNKDTLDTMFTGWKFLYERNEDWDILYAGRLKQYRYSQLHDHLHSAIGRFVRPFKKVERNTELIGQLAESARVCWLNGYIQLLLSEEATPNLIPEEACQRGSENEKASYLFDLLYHALKSTNFSNELRTVILIQIIELFERNPRMQTNKSTQSFLNLLIRKKTKGN